MEIKEKIELVCFIASMLYIIYIVKKAIRNDEASNTNPEG
jgi:hypothetical protein